MSELTCPYCAVVAEPDLGWRIFSNATVHSRAECRACGSFLQYLPQWDADGSPSKWVLLAPTRPEQPPLL